MTSSVQHRYDAEFFDYIEDGAVRSAEVVVPLVQKALSIDSVLDVGCGRGAWLSIWRRHGIKDVVGIDGHYVDPNTLLVPPTCFRPVDLSRPIDLGRRFALVQSLEVAEHIPESSADVFVDNLVRHGSAILFSAAVPGQGGEFHVNEQGYEYWRDKFLVRGYQLFDAFRPSLTEDRRVEPWYRFNLLFFVAGSAINRLDPAVIARRVADRAPVPDVSPLPFRIRKYALRCLPASQVTRLAVMKHKAANFLQRRQRR